MHGKSWPALACDGLLHSRSVRFLRRCGVMMPRKHVACGVRGRCIVDLGNYPSRGTNPLYWGSERSGRVMAALTIAHLVNAAITLEDN